MFAIRIEGQPIGAERDVGFERRLETWDCFERAGWSGLVCTLSVDFKISAPMLCWKGEEWTYEVCQ